MTSAGRPDRDGVDPRPARADKRLCSQCSNPHARTCRHASDMNLCTAAAAGAMACVCDHDRPHSQSRLATRRIYHACAHAHACDEVTKSVRLMPVFLSSIYIGTFGRARLLCAHKPATTAPEAQVSVPGFTFVAELAHVFQVPRHFEVSYLYSTLNPCPCAFQVSKIRYSKRVDASISLGPDFCAMFPLPPELISTNW